MVPYNKSVLTLVCRQVANRPAFLPWPGSRQRISTGLWRCHSGGTPGRRGRETLRSWAEDKQIRSDQKENSGGTARAEGNLLLEKGALKHVEESWASSGFHSKQRHFTEQRGKTAGVTGWNENLKTEGCSHRCCPREKYDLSDNSSLGTNSGLLQ